MSVEWIVGGALAGAMLGYALSPMLEPAPLPPPKARARRTPSETLEDSPVQQRRRVTAEVPEHAYKHGGPAVSKGAEETEEEE